MKTVCILAAGKGTRMGGLSEGFNKSLLPVKNESILTNLIHAFGADCNFVIAVGFKADQVSEFLQIAHPDLNLNLVVVDKFEGEGSGPGYSLSCCRQYLQKPFYFVPCDIFIEESIPDLKKNWVGISSYACGEDYCNFTLDKSGKVKEIHDKRVPPEPYKSFNGLMFINDYDDFWSAFDETKTVNNEIQISNLLYGIIGKGILAREVKVVDAGSLKGYTALINRFDEFDFSKSGESIYISGNRVIKYFQDQYTCSARIARSENLGAVVPSIDRKGKNFYSYKFIQGNVFYNVFDVEKFDLLLRWLSSELWVRKEVPDSFLDSCYKFYKTKTDQRISMYFDKYAEDSQSLEINGIQTPGVSELLEKIDWAWLSEGVCGQFHGDLQFDNIIYSDDGEFILLDWRQDFGGLIEVGDIYYDYAKLLGGIILNYDLVKKNKFFYLQKNRQSNFSFETHEGIDKLEPAFEKFCFESKFDYRKVKLIVAIIYLNMAPLHQAPFDQLLFDLGRVLLHKGLCE